MMLGSVESSFSGGVCLYLGGSTSLKNSQKIISLDDDT